MPDDSLVPLMPEVQTLARPTSGVLLAARHEIQRNPVLRQVFRKARDEDWGSSRFAAGIEHVLHDRIEGSYPEIREVCAYLADEYRQLGDSMLIVSRATGRAVYKVTEDDLWQPPEVVREDGHVVVPSPRLRPELEGYLVHWAFEEARDVRLLQEIQTRLPTTDYLTEVGDPRLKLVTRAGRKTIVEELRERLPTLLADSRNRPGTPSLFLRLFEIRSDDPEGTGLRPLLQSTAVASIRCGIQDVKAFNLRYDHPNMLALQIGAQWIAEIGRSLSLAAHHRGGRHMLFRDLVPDDLLGGVCVLSPAERKAIGDAFCLEVRPWVKLLPIDGARATLFNGPAGVLTIHADGYDLRSREVHDRWDIVARCEYTLWVDWRVIDALVLEDLPITPLTPEIVR